MRVLYDLFWKRESHCLLMYLYEHVRETETARPKKKPNLAKIREKLLCKRTAKRFTGYKGLIDDPNPGADPALKMTGSI